MSLDSFRSGARGQISLLTGQLLVGELLLRVQPQQHIIISKLLRVIVYLSENTFCNDGSVYRRHQRAHNIQTLVKYFVVL